MNTVFLEYYIFITFIKSFRKPPKKAKRPTQKLRQNLALYYETTIVVNKKISNISSLYYTIFCCRSVCVERLRTTGLAVQDCLPGCFDTEEQSKCCDKTV